MNRRDLAASLPDVPCWIYARALLAAPDTLAVAADSGHGFVISSARYALACVIGEPESAVVRAAVDRLSLDARVLGLAESEAAVARALRGWQSTAALIHVLGPSGLSPRRERTPVELLQVGEASRLAGWPQELASELASTREEALAAVAFVSGAPASVCYVAFETESLWDVSIDTAEPFRRRGLAEACSAALITEMKGRGKEAVWGAEATNEPSLQLAKKLGFVECDRLVLFRRVLESGNESR